MGTAATQKGALDPVWLQTIEESLGGTAVGGSEAVRVLYSEEAALVHSSFCEAATSFHYLSINVGLLSFI